MERMTMVDLLVIWMESSMTSLFSLGKWESKEVTTVKKLDQRIRYLFNNGNWLRSLNRVCRSRVDFLVFWAFYGFCKA
jgi:hypothetical protein